MRRHLAQSPLSTARKRDGFSLIEILIAIALVGIITAIVYPSYLDQIRQSRRAEAKSTLQTVLQQQERFYTDNNTYTGNLTNLGYANNTFTLDNGFYQVSAQQCGGAGWVRCVQVRAAALGDQQNDVCDQLTLNSRGQRTAQKNGSDVTQDCW